jgi:Spy/CpxP family protein refolding chaperone
MTRHFIRHLSRLLAVTTLSAAAMLAQGPRSEQAFGHGSTTPVDTAAAVQRQVTFLTTLLTLTTGQVTQATTIFTTAINAITPLQTSIATARTSLSAAVKSNATATIDQLCNTIGTLTGQITAIDNKADAAFYALLTADQKTKLDQLGADGFGGHGLGDIRVPGAGR